jgi:uncharacterized protein YprB with RNaseH-like and TPR domain
MGKWDKKYTLLITAVARNVGPFGVKWDAVGEELGETAKACESAFWRVDKDNNGQASIDAKILKHRIKGTPYAKMLTDFPGLTIEDLKARVKILADTGTNRWVDGVRIGFLDIESSHLKANIGIMLSWSMKLKDGEVLYDVINREEAIDKDKQDKRIVKSLLDAIDQNVDMLVTYYGTGFDIPFIRTRAMYWGFDDCLGHGDKIHYDLYYTVRGKLQLHSNRLAVATEFLGIEGKTRLPPETWGQARLGYPEALEYVVDHCNEDVIILEDLYNEVKKYKKMTRKSV